jgi:predicted DNA-binding transcriptional regulator AlpA
MMTREQLNALPPVLDVPTAAQVLGIGRSLAYDLVRHGTWPTPVLRIGRLTKIPTAPLLRMLETGEPGAAPAHTLVGYSPEASRPPVAHSTET